MTEHKEPTLGVGEAANLLCVHPNTLRQWEAQGLIKSRRVGSRRDRLFLQSDVELLRTSALIFKPKKRAKSSKPELKGGQS